MKIIPIITTIIISFTLFGCNKQNLTNYSIEGEQSKIIKEMIDAVNEKDAEKYVKGFAEKVQVFVESEMK